VDGVDEDVTDSGRRCGGSATWERVPLSGVYGVSEKLGEEGVVEAGDIHNEGGIPTCERST
jgi:hypothetical protein